MSIGAVHTGAAGAVLNGYSTDTNEILGLSFLRPVNFWEGKATLDDVDEEICHMINQIVSTKSTASQGPGTMNVFDLQGI